MPLATYIAALIKTYVSNFSHLIEFLLEIRLIIKSVTDIPLAENIIKKLQHCVKI